MSDKEDFEKIKEAFLSDGGKIFLNDLSQHKEAMDTINVLPIWNTETGVVVSPTTDELLKRQGYVSALNWVIGIITHYQSGIYEE